MRRALTLLETLLALAILSAVTGAMVSWLTVASGTSATAGAAASWEISARRALNLIAEDIHTFDRPHPRRRTDDRPARIKIESSGNHLILHTRNGANGIEHSVRYELDGKLTGRLLRGGVSILQETTAFQCELDEQARILQVTITCAIGDRALTRRYRAP